VQDLINDTFLKYPGTFLGVLVKQQKFQKKKPLMSQNELRKSAIDKISAISAFKKKVKNDHRSKFSNLSSWREEACDDHCSLSSTTAVHIRIISHILHIISAFSGQKPD